MIRGCFEEKEVTSSGRYMRNNADMPKLYAISLFNIKLLVVMV